VGVRPEIREEKDLRVEVHQILALVGAITILLVAGEWIGF